MIASTYLLTIFAAFAMTASAADSTQSSAPSQSPPVAITGMGVAGACKDDSSCEEGLKCNRLSTQDPSSDGVCTVSDGKVVELGAKCGGFMRSAPQCANGLTCKLGPVSDGGGVCEAGTSTTPGNGTVPNAPSGNSTASAPGSLVSTPVGIHPSSALVNQSSTADSAAPAGSTASATHAASESSYPGPSSVPSSHSSNSNQTDAYLSAGVLVGSNAAVHAFGALCVSLVFMFL
ncbi:hypothetical protein BDV3_003142 [Batrachochytrium dendrobatidis]